MDLGKLIVNGHSFGGGTVIGVAARDKRIKACIALDPWLYPYENELDSLV